MLCQTGVGQRNKPELICPRKCLLTVLWHRILGKHFCNSYFQDNGVALCCFFCKTILCKKKLWY